MTMHQRFGPRLTTSDPPKRYIPWRRCPDAECDVRWKEDDPDCWMCGKRGLCDYAAVPRPDSQYGYIAPFNEADWAITRREIGVA